MYIYIYIGKCIYIKCKSMYRFLLHIHTKGKTKYMCSIQAYNRKVKQTTREHKKKKKC